MLNSNADLYADVVLPLAFGKLFTYKVPDESRHQISPGIRVIVPFGKSKMYTAVVHAVHFNKPEFYQAKEILEILDVKPVVTETQFKLWDWMASYYLCTLGEIMTAALPSVMKLQSENGVALNPDFVADNVLLTSEEQLLIDALSDKKSITVAEAGKITGNKKGLRLIRNMIERKMLIPTEEIGADFQKKQIAYVKFTTQAEDEDFLQAIFQTLEKKAPKQLDLLMGFMRIKMDKGTEFISKSLLLKNTDSNSRVLQQLIDKNVFEVFEGDESLAYNKKEPASISLELSDVQQQAFDAIEYSFSEKKVALLHGVTSSGKTEVYIKLMNEQIAKGKQVLYLLPEIALTTQIISRLKNHFGERLLVYHSRFSSRERAEVYTQVLNDGEAGHYHFPIIIGARSAIFLPLTNPGLIIVDEEHDSSYKQFDPSPRYNARDSAIVCGTILNASVLLGSATPSMESYYNASIGKYNLIRMGERYGGIRMPEIAIKDIKEAYRKKEMKSHFSQTLLDGIKLALDNREQVILFQNRRGFAPVLECKNCGWIPQCVNCDVSLTYHKKLNQLRCHYCGYSTHPPGKCMACGDPDIRMKGLGTERIEDEISIFFPDHRIARFDLDSTSSKSSFQRILSGFENGEIDILVGTQMVTKGLDFENVSLVGVLNADNLINFPDFRAAERSYQLLAQVSGRAGRRSKRGKVLIQTYQIGHPILQFLINNDYRGFYTYELAERERFNYPPFCRLISLRLKLRDEKQLDALAKDFTKVLKSVFGKRVLGPVAPNVSRIRNLYIRNVLIKVEKNLSDHKVKQMITSVTDRFLSHPENRSLIIHVDVDPA
ncbi:MAG: primosomal protein N' [Bacteroidetes bacterium]|nr:primosomal protein N' [Bacteroidota bacterium]